MQTKQIIDQHFTENYNYYKGVCYKYYKGRYLWEDLLNETYIEFLSVKPEIIIKFHKIGKLGNIGTRLIHYIYGKRKRRLSQKTSNGVPVKTSPLYESSEVYYNDFDPKSDIDIDDLISDDINPVETRKKAENLENNIEKLNYLISSALKKDSAGDITEKYPSPFLAVSTFLQVNESSISEVSRKTKIPRYYLTEIYRGGQQYLKNNLK